MTLHERHSYVTLATNDEYAIGALVLGYSLRRAGTNKEMAILITEGVSHGFREILEGVYDSVIVVNPLQSLDEHNLKLLRRLNLGITYTKLYCWKLIQFSKCVFLDADTIVLQNIDELFEREELSATPDVSWPDMFNSGVFVFRPSLKTFSDLSELAKTRGSFDGGDQGLLNEYFNGWSTETLDKHLPFAYNCSCWVTPNDRLVFYTRAPAWKKFGNQVKVAHFAGLEKPWRYSLAANDAAICHAIERLESSDTNFTDAEQTSVLALWWAIFFKRVKHQLSYGMFLSTTFEPVPLSPPPPTPLRDHASQHQEQNQFHFENECYHPEFHDTSFDHLHSGQRVDEARRFEEYYVYEEPPKHVEPLCHKYCEDRMEHKRHDLHYHQQPAYHHHEENQQPHYEKHCFQPTSQEYHQEQYDPAHQKNSLPQQQQHRQNEMCHHNQHHQQQQQWHDQTHHEHYVKLSSPPPLSGQDHVETQRDASSFQSSLSLQPPPPPEPPETRNDKDPLFFAPNPMCCECLKELQWSRQFVDPFHRDLISPVSSLSVATRVRRRSTPLLPLGPELIRGSQKLTFPIVVIEEPSKASGIQSRKKEKESCLHQIQRGKLNKKRRRRKSIERGKLLDAARKQMQLKEGGNMQTIAPFPMSTPDNSPTQLEGEDTTTPPTALKLESTLTTKMNKGQLQSKGNNVKNSTISTSVSTLTVAADKSRKQLKKDGKIIFGSVLPVSLTSATTPGTRRMQLKGDTMTSLAMVSTTTNANTKTTTTTPKSKVLDVTSLKEPALDALASRQGEITSLNTPMSMSEEGSKALEPRKGEGLNDFYERSKFESHKPKRTVEHEVEDTPVNDAPWLPRIVKTRSAPKKLSQGSQYFCDRHRPHSPPPDWRMFAWERGDIDYTGSDRFSNILARIRTTIQQAEEEAMPIGVWL